MQNQTGNAALFEELRQSGLVEPTTVENQPGSAAQVGEVLGPICERHQATVPQIALAWLLHRSPFMLPIPGTSSLTHLEENLGAAAIALTAEEVNAITRLVPGDTGVPKQP